MHLLVVGATGRLGARLVERAVARGHQVRALSRSVRQEHLPEGAEACPGSALDPADVDAATAGVDAVIVALSMVRTSDSPWARITTPLDLHTRAASFLTGAAARHGVGRYVMVSAHGAGLSAPRAGVFFRALVRGSNIGVAYGNLAPAEGIVRASALDWTIVRPTRLTSSPGVGRWRASADLTTGSLASIPREDVAAFLIEAVEQGTWIREAVSVTGA